MDCASSPANNPETHAARAQAALWRQVDLLGALAETGVQLAQTLAAQAAAAPAERPEAVAMAFSRVARAVRMTALLQSRLIKDLDEACRRAEIVTPEQQEQAAEEEARLDPAHGHKARVEAIIVRVARAQNDDEAYVDRIVIEAAERLDDDDIYGDVLTRPVGELVALICRDLGLSPDWERLAREAWAQEEMASGNPSSPFSGHGVVRPPSFAAANGGGGPPAEERVVVGAGLISTIFSASPERQPRPSG